MKHNGAGDASMPYFQVGNERQYPRLPESCSQQEKERLLLMVQLIQKTDYVDSSSLKQGVASAQRSHDFQTLIRRFLIQIRYGCSEKYCTTPTCFSCHKRVHTFPVRRPTVLTARALAFELASGPDPYSALCPHQPSALSDDFTRTNNGGVGKEHICLQFLATKDVQQEIPHSQRHQSALEEELAEFDPMEEPKKEEADVTETLALPTDHEQVPERKTPALDYRENHLPPGYKKDRKSLTQSLLDTRSVKSFEWRNILSPMDILKKPPIPIQEPAEEAVKRQDFIPGTTVPWHEPKRKTASDVLVAVELTRNMMIGLRSFAFQSMGVGFDPSAGFHHGDMPPPLKPDDQDSSTRLDAATYPHMLDYTKRTLLHHFGHPDRLRTLIRRNKIQLPNKKLKPHSAPRIHQIRLDLECFSRWVPIVGSLILDSIWQSLEGLFIPPPTIASRVASDAYGRSRDPNKLEYIPDPEAADMIYVAILALVGSGYSVHERSLETISNLRAWGRTLPDSNQSGRPDPLSDPWLNVSDDLEYEPAIRLAKRLVRAIAARRSCWHMSRAMQGDTTEAKKFPVMEMVVTHIVNERAVAEHVNNLEKLSFDPLPLYLMEWLRTVILKTWDREALVKRWEGTGAAVEILADLYRFRKDLGLAEERFQMPFLSGHIPDSKFPIEFARQPPNVNTLNILRYSFLFMRNVRIAWFRTINFANMIEAFESGRYTDFLKKNMFVHLGTVGARAGRRGWNRDAFLETNMKVALAKYLVLDVRRDHLLEDAFNQLWGREKRELFRPLKVRMGVGAGGEEGVDQGGVSQEFFRLVFAKAFDPEAGLFATTDTQSQMTWFQPLSLEPLQTYELLGLLIGLAVYNGVSLPTSFPLVLYQKLLGMLPAPEIFQNLQDGWPSLMKSFSDMLAWKDGDVADVYVREYAFSFSANGQKFTIDMTKHAQKGKSPLLPTDCVLDANEANDIPLVTNHTRRKFVLTYLTWLTYNSIHPQYEAFAKGFYTLIPQTTLQLLSPSLFKTLAEGFQVFDIRGLYKVAKYEDGYSKDTEVIQWFWTVVFALDELGKKRLLEFVTASDRVPVQGWGGLSFTVLRNGGDTERIPTSMTCFGKLLLPEYSSFEKLKKKLEIALENSTGFGSA